MSAIYPDALGPFATLLQFSPGHLMPTRGGFFPRNFKKAYPIAVRGEGCWIIAADGRRFLDASGQAAVVGIGHGVPEIGRAMAAQSSQIAFAHTSHFHTAPAEKLPEHLLALAPPNFRNGGRVYFTSGGSEATETAIKLARQFHLESGQKERYRVLSRGQSLHGSTLGAMSASGNAARRSPYAPLLAEWGHLAPCFCNHCPFEKVFPQCELACADDLQVHLLGHEPEKAAAFIFEPVVGATLGAAVPPEGYAARIAEICRKHGILLIADEIMTGMGRTGKSFAVEHWGVEPDMILVGKGVASGYAPLGAVLVSARVVAAFERGSGVFMHGFSYQAHPVCTAAGNAVLDFLESRKLFDRVAPAEDNLRDALSPLQSHTYVGELRSLGLLLGIEFVKDKAEQRCLPLKRRHARIAEFANAGNLLRDAVARDLLSGSASPEKIQPLNEQLLQVESNRLEPAGIPGRPWFRHLLYSSRYTYAHLEFPGLTEAVEKHDWKLALQQAVLLEKALEKNTKLLRSAQSSWEKDKS